MPRHLHHLIQASIADNGVRLLVKATRHYKYTHPIKRIPITVVPIRQLNPVQINLVSNASLIIFFKKNNETGLIPHFYPTSTSTTASALDLIPTQGGSDGYDPPIVFGAPYTISNSDSVPHQHSSPLRSNSKSSLFRSLFS